MSLSHAATKSRTTLSSSAPRLLRVPSTTAIAPWEQSADADDVRVIATHDVIAAGYRIKLREHPDAFFVLLAFARTSVWSRTVCGYVGGIDI
jgi:hypothetical protein